MTNRCRDLISWQVSRTSNSSVTTSQNDLDSNLTGSINSINISVIPIYERQLTQNLSVYLIPFSLLTLLGLTTEGIFRRSVSLKQLRDVQNLYNNGKLPLLLLLSYMNSVNQPVSRNVEPGTFVHWFKLPYTISTER